MCYRWIAAQQFKADEASVGMLRSRCGLRIHVQQSDCVAVQHFVHSVRPADGAQSLRGQIALPHEANRFDWAGR